MTYSFSILICCPKKFGQVFKTNLNRNKNLKLALLCQEQEEPSGKISKPKLFLEALKEKDTIEVLAKKYEVLPNQISMWKAEALSNLAAIFSLEISTPNIKATS